MRAGAQALVLELVLVRGLAQGTAGAALVAQTEVSLSLHRQLFPRRELPARIAARFAEETVEGTAVETVDGTVAGTVEELAGSTAAGQSNIEAGTSMELRTVEPRRTDWALRTEQAAPYDRTYFPGTGTC